MTTEATEPDLITEAEELLANPIKRIGRTGYAYELLRRLVEENKRLQGELEEIYDCDKCDLCEDH